MNRTSIPLQNIDIQDTFWNRYIDLVRTSILPYQWEAINDRVPGAEPSHSIANFRIAAGREQGEFYGAVFQDTDVAKWLEAVAYTLASHPDPALEKTADEVIDLIADAQGDDGYINTYFTIKAPDQRWKNLTEGHELYTAGHLIEAAVAYYQATGKCKFLDVMARFADLICQTFGPNPGQIHGYPGHQEIELALVRLYGVKPEQTYLDTAKYFLDARGTGENYFVNEQKNPDYSSIFDELKDIQPAYLQAHAPVREQDTAEGHAVRAVYMYAAMADIAQHFGDSALLDACKRLWNNIVEKRMYITGGIGSSGILERFTTDYDLPNDENYSESCASIGLALFGLRMARITGESHYLDVVERALYNTVLAGISMDGTRFFYVNPLEVWPPNLIPRTSKEHVKPVRQPWFGVACCPPNIARTLASLGQYIYSVDDASLYVNLFIANHTHITLDGQALDIQLETRFPIENTYALHIQGVQPKGVNIRLRIPNYAQNMQLSANGTPMDYTVENGFAQVRIQGDTALHVQFDADATFIQANPHVRADIGKTAMVRGPLVYCLEETDNGADLAAVFVDSHDTPAEVFDENLFGGTLTLHVKAKKLTTDHWDNHTLYQKTQPVFESKEIRAIPYAFWGNRQPGEMIVWLHDEIPFS